jgi:hypothetical protein
MSAHQPVLSRHPAPHRERASVAQLTFGLLAGPAAWFGQLCAGFPLSSWPCFPRDQHVLAPLTGYEWTWAAVGIVSLAAVAVSLAAMIVSLRLLRRTSAEVEGDHMDLLEVGSGRTRFLALWGTIAGAAFAVVSTFTGVAFFILPRCAG